MPDDTQARILMMGDSMLATHSLTGRSVSHMVEAQIGEEVIDRTVPGARMIYALPLTGAAGLNIPKQYRPGKWDWVVLNGGGNDLLLGCGCMFCNRKLEQLISEDGRRGAIPGFVSRLRQDGARWRGYVDDWKVFDVVDDPAAHAGPVYRCGHIALRCMRNTRMLWRNLRVYTRPLISTL